jgi:hypothetical protein
VGELHETKGTAIYNRDLVSEIASAAATVAVAIINRGSCP